MTEANVRAELAAEFTGGEVLQFVGRGGKTFDYIEDETVMDRLDDVFGVGMWSITVVPISVADGIVKVTLKVSDAVYEDFGYASNSNPESELLKEAVSDGIRRCGRYLGIGRYLYRKHDTRRAAGPVPRPRPVPRDVGPVAAPDPYGDDLTPIDQTLVDDETACAIHGVVWKGTPGDLYHKKDEGGYCRHPGNIQKPRAAAR